MILPRLQLLRGHFDSDENTHLQNIQFIEDWAQIVRVTVVPYFTGSGKNNANDDDFKELGIVPRNGFVAIVFNTTTNAAHLSARADGNWVNVLLT